MLGEVKHFPVEVAIDNVHVHVKSLLHTLHGWNPEEINIQPMPGGHVNVMLKCCNTEKDVEPVVLRTWPTEAVMPCIDHETEIKCVRILSKKRCFPTLIFTFDNGYCYRFYTSEPFNYEPIDDRLVNAFTKGLAIFHSTEVADIKKTTMLSEMCFHIGKANENEWNISKTKFKYDLVIFLISFSNCFKCLFTTINSRDFPSKNEYQRTFLSVTEMIVESKSPVVLCHGDCHFHNCLWTIQDDHAVFVDCEFTKYNYQAWDIAYHFYSYTYEHEFGKDITPEDKEGYQQDWIRKYLKAWYEVCGKSDADPTELDIYTLHVQVKKCILAVALWIAFTVLVMVQVKLKDLDLPSFGYKAYTFFLNHYEEYANLTLPGT